MYKLEVRHHFDAAHYLPGHEGKCSQPHGHRWEVVVRYTLKAISEPVNMLVDFGHIKSVIDELDHTTLNDWFTFPSAEQIAYHLWSQMPVLPNYQSYIEVEVWESPNCMVSYSGYRSVGRDYIQSQDMVETPDLPGEVYER